MPRRKKKDMKKQFIDFMRMSYGAETDFVSNRFPPLRTAFEFPAFQKETPQPQLPQGPVRGLAGMMQQRQPDTQRDVRDAQRVLLGGGRET